MRFAVTPQQRTYFQKNQLISFEECLDPVSVADDVKPTDKVLLRLIKKGQLAEIAFELTGKTPLRFARVFKGEQSEQNEDECALFLSLESGSVTYTTLPLYKGEESCYLILVFTTRYLNESSHPTLFRGY